MILPTKHLPADKALLTLGATLIEALTEPRSVSSLWDLIRRGRDETYSARPIAYDWFVLALDLLFMIGAVHYERGRIVRAS
jgi:hypothetical protein